MRQSISIIVLGVLALLLFLYVVLPNVNASATSLPGLSIPVHHTILVTATPVIHHHK
jgi:hypothetical protein